MTIPTIGAQSQLPLLPLRDIVALPCMTFPLFVGRPKSVKAIEEAMKQGQSIMLVMQKTAAKDKPSKEDFYAIGCVANILWKQTLPDGTVKVQIEGARRARTDHVSELDTHFIADITLMESFSRNESEVEPMRRAALEQYEQYVKLNKQMPPDVLTSLAGIDDSGRLADTIAVHLPLTLEKKQTILEILDVAKRYEYLLGQLEDELDNLQRRANAAGIVEAPFERGSLRNIFDEIIEHNGSDAWPALSAHLACIQAARDCFLEIKHRPAGKCGWPDIADVERINLYCASRVSDLMLLGFQQGEHGWNGPNITRSQYIEFWKKLAFETVEPTSFHPFWCELVEVIESESDDIEILEVVWPALTLGPLMFSRSGVCVSAPRKTFTAGIADRSTLFWSYVRRYRKASDMSHGWGHNSQWSTDLRLDFDLGDRYVYNADLMRPHDLRALPEDYKDEYGMSRTERIDLLRHRCLTRPVASLGSDADVFPFKDFFEEPKE